MGIFDALTTAVSGLGAQAYALQNISGNIANSQTTAYKRTNTSFEDLVSDNLPSKQIAGGVLASSVATNNVQGDLQNVSTSTFMAINGNGYFIVKKPDGFSGNLPVFSGVNLYTRRGDYQTDKSGYLVNQAGYYLMGLPVDPTTGNPLGSVPVVLKFNNNLIPAQATTQVQYNANLPSSPITPSTQAGVAGSNLLDPTAFTSSPIVTAAVAASIVGSTGTLPQDTAAVGTGSANLGVGGTLLVGGLGLTNGDVISVSDGTNTTNYTVTGASTITNLLAALSGGSAAVTVTQNGGNQLVIQSSNNSDTVTLSATGAGANADLTALGYATAGSRTFGPTNASLVAAVGGQTITVTVGSNTTQTIDFGAGASQIGSLKALETALKATVGVNAGATSVVRNAAGSTNGKITLTAANTTDVIVVTGAAATTLGLPTLQGFPVNLTVFGIDQSTFVDESVAGGSITAYDGVGTPVNMQFRWGKVDSAILGGSHVDTWNLFFQANSSASNTQAAWVNAGTDFVFDATGQLTPTISSLTLNNVIVDGVSLGTVSVIFGAGGVTQFANSNGNVQVNLLDQNGAPAGQLQSVAVDDQGRIVGTYSNGRIIPLAEVTLANFNGQNYLKRLDGGAYAETSDSGPAILNATGKIVGSSLESSNSDIADEFSKLIVTQQAYSANTRIITTTNQMVQDLLNVIR
jgi:flagellar hook protein FlgE